MKFEWDEAKNIANQRKHNVSFELASELLDWQRDDVLVIVDEAHSDDEDRFISIGPLRENIVLVVWTERFNDIIRIISARRATTDECELYVSHVRGAP